MTFTETILDWYGNYGRELPWRRTKDPYAIWLSEIILQQTRIAQGTAYWERFMARFPDVQSLAVASEDEVLRLWEGLGYYSRARNLHAAARQIVAQGAFPASLDGIKALKGIGDYTAAAIASIAFGIPAAVVDGNVYRVLSRHFGIDTPVGTTVAKKEFTALAQSLLPEDRPGDFNQGMMDFGALQCTPQSPDCLTCPLCESCDALRTGRTGSLPVKKAGPAVRDRHFVYIYLRCDGMTAIRRRDAGDIWQGLWEPYLLEYTGENPGLPEWTSSGSLTLIRTGVRHQLTHRTLHTDFYLFLSDTRPPLPDAFRWIPESDLDRYAKPRLFEILLAELNKQNSPAI
jgi:A/G-specific adenine glycosylase